MRIASAVHAHLGLLALGEDGVVGLEAVRREERLAVRDLHVCVGLAGSSGSVRTKEGVAKREEDGRHDG